MPLSPEARIYDKAQVAPKPTELKDGLELLLDTFGKTTVAEKDGHPLTSQQLVIQPNLSSNANLIIFKSVREGQFSPRFHLSFVSKDDSSSRKTPLNGYSVKYTGGIEMIGASEEENDLFAISSITGVMTEKEKRTVGGLVLGAWEALVSGERQPFDITS